MRIWVVNGACQEDGVGDIAGGQHEEAGLRAAVDGGVVTHVQGAPLTA